MAAGAKRSLSELARQLPRTAGLCAEQITPGDQADAAGDDEEEVAAVVVDQFGRAHSLRPLSVIGREAEGATIAVLQSSVSRRHLELRLGAAAGGGGGDGGWTVRDLGSTNGSFLDGARLGVGESRPLRDRQIVAVGDVSFLFVSDRASLAAHPATESFRVTSASPRGGAEAVLRLSGTASGAGGVAELGELTVQLGSTQFALLTLLAERLGAERDAPPATRGFVRSVEIIASLPWDTAHPEDNHVKQLVRRVRRALERLGLVDVIESRHGFGYRLLIEPEL